jgi:hypothetical protein
MTIFGPKREEVKGQQRRLHDEDLDLCLSPNTFGDQINKNEMSKTCRVQRIILYNIKMVLQEVGCG